MTHKIRYYVRIYFMIILQDIKSKMQYRMDFYFSSLGMIVTNLSGLIAFWILFKSITNLRGWSYNEILFMYSFSLLTLTPVQLFFENLWNLKDNTISGDFIKYYFRPLNIFFYYVSEIFDMKALNQMIFGFVTLIYECIKLHIPFTAVNVLLAFIFISTASLVMIAMMVAASALSFYVTDSSYIISFIFKFREYAKYPVTIFNNVFKFVFSFILPIGFISFYPSQLFLRPHSISVMTIISPIIGMVFFVFSYLFWMRGALKFVGTGS